jgi:hypothetical protein
VLSAPARALVVVLVALAACEKPAYEVRLPLRATGVPGDTLRPGDHLEVVAWLRNPSRHALRLEFDDQCQVEIYVLGPDRTVLYPPGGGASCMGAPSVLEIAPRDSVRFHGRWLATSSTFGEHVAYAVLWPHHVPRDDERPRVARPTHRSNVLVRYVLPDG